MKICVKITVFIIISTVLGCSKVPISGRKQITLVPEIELMRMSLVQYKQFLTENPPVSDEVEATKQVKRVGNRVANAIERYLKDNGQSKKVKDYRWEFNLVNQNVVNAWAMPGGKVVVYQGLLPVAQSDAGLAVVINCFTVSLTTLLAFALLNPKGIFPQGWKIAVVQAEFFESVFGAVGRVLFLVVAAAFLADTWLGLADGVARQFADFTKSYSRGSQPDGLTKPACRVSALARSKSYQWWYYAWLGFLILSVLNSLCYILLFDSFSVV